MKKSIILISILSITLPLFSQSDSRYDAGLNLPFNEKEGEINPQTGNVTLNFTDVELPGRAGMNFSFGRIWTLNQSNVYNMDLHPTTGNNRISGHTTEAQNRLGVGWSSNLPYLHWDESADGSVLHLFYGGSAYQVENGSLDVYNASESNLMGYDLLDKRIYGGSRGGAVGYSDFGNNNPTNQDTTEDSEYVLILKDNSRYYFRASGGLMMHQDKTGQNQIWYFYDDQDRLSVVVDTVGREIRFSYDSDGNLSSIEWDVETWELDDQGNRVLNSHTRQVNYEYRSLETFPESFALKEQVIDYEEPFALVSVTNPLGLRTEYEYQEGVASFSFNDRYHRDNVYLMLTGLYQNVYQENGERRYSSAQRYAYEVPARGMFTRFFYSGYMEYYRVSDRWFLDRNGREMSRSSYSYFAEGENGNYNRYSTVVQAGGVTKTYLYSTDAADNRNNVLDQLITETEDGFRELRDMVYDNNRTKVLEEVFRQGQFAYREQYAYDDRGNLKRMTDRLGLVTVREYDPVYSIPIKESRIFEWEGREETYRREWIIDNLGQVIREVLFMERATGALEAVTLAEYGYDVYGNPVEVTDAEGFTQHTVYDSATNSLPVYQWQEVSLDSYQSGNPEDRWQDTPDAQTPARIETRTLFNSDGTPYLQLDSQGYSIEHFYDALGREVQTVMPDADDDRAWISGLTTNTIDIPVSSLTGFFTSRRNNPGTRTLVDDHRAYQESIADLDVAAGTVLRTSSQGDGLGHVLEETSYDAAGEAYGVKRMEYDRFGRMITLTDPDAGSEFSNLNVDGEVFHRYDQTWVVKYDDLGRQIKVGYPMTRQSVGDTKTISYQDDINQVTTVDPEGRITLVQNDWAGNMIRTERRGTSNTPQMDWRIYQNEYDSLGRMRLLIDAQGEETRYNYNEMDLLIEQDYGSTGSDWMEYDDRGLLLNKTDRNGNRIENQYDEAGRVISSSRYFPNGDLDETTRISYDLRGLSWRIEGNDLTEYYVYDEKGQVVTLSRFFKDDTIRNQSNAVLAQTGNAYTFQYQYNDGGMVTSMIYPDGAEHLFSYRDGLGYLDEIREAGFGRIAGDFQYNLSGVVTNMTWANGVEQHWEFDDRKRINRISLSRGGNELIEEIDYRLNAVGDMTQIGDNEYSYNGFGEIIGARTLIPGQVNQTALVEESFGSFDADSSWTNEIPFDQEADLNNDGRVNGQDHFLAFVHDNEGAFDVEIFDYDRGANRTRLIQNDTEFRYDYGERNRLLAIYRRDNGSETLVQSFEYDFNGNTIRRVEYINNTPQVTEYEYDTLNRLVVSHGPNGSASYRYDNAGNRYFKTGSQGSTLYLRHGQIAVAMDLEWDGGSSTVNRYILSGDLIAGRVSNEGGAVSRSYYHLDHLNSTKWVTDENAFLEVRYEYRAFGEQLKRLNGDGDEVDDIADYSYSGKELDGENELYYFNARYYDASLGRFINVDPIQDGLNWYVYCSNNPINMVDPTGLDDSSINWGQELGQVLVGSIGFSLGKVGAKLNLGPVTFEAFFNIGSQKETFNMAGESEYTVERGLNTTLKINAGAGSFEVGYSKTETIRNERQASIIDLYCPYNGHYIEEESGFSWGVSKELGGQDLSFSDDNLIGMEVSTGNWTFGLSVNTTELADFSDKLMDSIYNSTEENSVENSDLD